MLPSFLKTPSTILFGALIVGLLLSAALMAGPVFRDATIRMDKYNGVPSEVRFHGAERPTVAGFWETFRRGYDISDAVQIKELRVGKDALGHRHHRFVQVYRGVEVADFQYLVHESAEQVHLAHGYFLRGLQLDVTPALDEPAARERALRAVGATHYMWENPRNEAWLKQRKSDPAATFYPRGELKISTGRAHFRAENARLVYRFVIFADLPYRAYRVDVDAHSGEIVDKVPLNYDGDVPGSGASLYNGTVTFTADSVDSATYRLREAARGTLTTLDALNGTSFAQAVDYVDTTSVFTAPRARVGVSTHWALEGTYDYFRNVHARDSFDGAGAPILAYTHWDNGWFNAQWLGGLNGMRFGDGTNNRTPLVSIDVVGHEFTHGVTEFSSNLIYQGESGALNESFSDIFGTLIEFYLEGPAGDWLVGEDFGAIRSMENPGQFGDPDTYAGTRWADPSSPTDNGGVHSNSGVQNFWFYLLAEGGSGVNDNGDIYNIAGIGLDAAAQIAYRNLTVYLQPPSPYQDARLGAIFSAIDLFGENSPEYFAVIDAWNAVGVYFPTLAPNAAVTDTLSFLTEFGRGSQQKLLGIMNGGLDSLIIDSVRVSGNDFRLVNPPVLPARLAFGDTLSIPIEFDPVQSGSAFGAVQVFSNDPANPEIRVTLSGRAFVVTPAQEGVIYAVGGVAANGTVLTIDPNTGAGTLLGPSGFSELLGASINPLNGELVAGTTFSSNLQLVRIDALSGEGHAGVQSDQGLIYALAFDLNGDLYAARFNNGQLYRIDPADGTLISLGSLGFTRVNGLAVNPLDGQLWGIDLTGNVYQIDKTSAASTPVGNTGFNRLNDLAFDAEGKLFGLVGIVNDVNKLIRIDPATGEGSEIGSTNFRGLNGIAIRGTVAVGIEDLTTAHLPVQFDLRQNYPNPFNPATNITYTLPEPAEVTIKIFNTLGQEIRTLVDDRQHAGVYHLIWDGKDRHGEGVASGVYLYRMDAGPYRQTRKMLLLR